MTVPKTLAVVLNPASGLQNAESSRGCKGTRRQGDKETRRQGDKGTRQKAESRKQTADGTTSLRGTKQSSVPFLRIASFLAMTNALSVLIFN
jgi:hypothetical protein